MVFLYLPFKRECFLYDFKDPYRKPVRSIPIVDHVWEEWLRAMKNPATVIPVLPRLEKKYKAPDSSPASLTGQPWPDSVKSRAAQRKSRNPAVPLTTPPDKEGRLLDNAGKRFSSMASLLVRAANALAIMGRYDCQLWTSCHSLTSCHRTPSWKPKRSCKREKLPQQRIDCAMDIATTAFCSLAGATVLCCQG